MKTNMDKPLQVVTQSLIDLLKKYSEEKKAEGLIPTIDLLIEEMEEKLKHE